MKIFSHNLNFSQHNPLDDGLGDQIDAERREEGSFKTLNDPSGEELAQQWSAIVDDIKSDPDWFSFSED